MPDFDEWFKKATGNKPFPYQRRFAEAGNLAQIVDAPTGCGKTAMAILGWLWRRRFHESEAVRKGTPRRLVYCLPMRVLVEQTVENARTWLKNLGLLAEDGPKPEASEKIALDTLMGGDVDDAWTIYPERDAILVGTQDMLLSRALNRGYAMSRFQWPRSFGLLNNDCLWVLDEVQLMGPGLATSAQLGAFREPKKPYFGVFGNCPTLWMSATLQKEWLKTVDFTPAAIEPFQLSEKDRTQEFLKKRLEAVKRLAALPEVRVPMRDYPIKLAQSVKNVHRPSTATLIVVNTVQRAKEIYKALTETPDGQPSGSTARRQAKDKKQEPSLLPELVLIHSRFRLPERRVLNQRIMFPIPGGGRIIVATQVVEAGVDISARVLFTELAPWASLVQRFGRCNRYGEHPDARVFWIDIPQESNAPLNPAAPYELVDLQPARERLTALEGKSVASAKLGAIRVDGRYPSHHVIRRRDLVDLFDTTPDLSGNDVDVSRFMRADEERDVYLFWRDPADWAGHAFPDNRIRPRRDELCPAPIQEVRGWLKIGWCWDHLDGRWVTVRPTDLRPGMVLLLPSDAGGYSWDPATASGAGWDREFKGAIPPVPASERTSDAKGEEAMGHDPYTSSGAWRLLRDHSDDVVRETEALLARLSDFNVPEWVSEAIILAARWHDAGKSHQVFQGTLRSSNPANPPPGEDGVWAKSPGKSHRHARPHFRHELASALALLQNPGATPEVSAQARDLAAYLVASHHGKVRLSIRSFPGEIVPHGGGRYALGVWEGDRLPAADLGAGVQLPATVLDLSLMELGLGNDGGPSWIERMLALRDLDDLGPFRLAFLEALIRAADARASAIPKTEGVGHE